MTSVLYEDIFDSFLWNIEDTNLASLTEKDANSVMSIYLQKALAKPYIRKIFSTISVDDDMEEISFEMETEGDEESDAAFVKDILAKGMVVEWLQPIVKKTSLLKQMITSSKESKFFSQSQHLSEMRALLEDTENEVRNMIRDRGYLINGYLGD